MLRLEGVSRGAMNVVLFKTFEAIAKCGGWIGDQHLFSNKMASIKFWIPPARVGELIAMLCDQGIATDAQSPSAEPLVAEIPAVLVLTFVNSDPELARNVPPFE